MFHNDVYNELNANTKKVVGYFFIKKKIRSNWGELEVPCNLEFCFAAAFSPATPTVQRLPRSHSPMHITRAKAKEKRIEKNGTKKKVSCMRVCNGYMKRVLSGYLFSRSSSCKWLRTAEQHK